MASLYVVATPIGNLDDITRRAIEVLKGVSLIVAEDTRHTRRLLSHLGIATRLQAYHDQNEDEAAAGIVERIIGGESVALVSDAGTPLISDPGYRLVRRALDKGIPVVPVPGPSAVVAALSVSGQPTDRFAFEGFLPAKAAARGRALQKLRFERRTMVFYEAPHRIRRAITDMGEIFGEDRNVTLARELTKQFEQVWNGTLSGASECLADGTIPERGEFVVIVKGSTRSEEAFNVRELLEALLVHLPPRKAVDVASRLVGHSKRSLYDLALRLKQNT
jgi:16S rRNA (cytidine1402-2'-O)-methyltransferase